MPFAAGNQVLRPRSRVRRAPRAHGRATALGPDLDRRIWRRAGLARGMNVLQLGCAAGQVAVDLARAVAPGRVLGVDSSERRLRQARAVRRACRCDNLEFQRADIYDLDPPPSSFDFAYARFLFQHLRDPLAAAETVFDVLRPGARFCVVDIDDDWLVLHPRPGLFKAFMRWAAADQRRLGGDRNVGRKLPAYLQEAGFEEVHTFVEVLTSQEVGLEAFLDITTGLVRNEIADEEPGFIHHALDDIYSVLEDAHAWGAMGIFVAVGQKV